MRGTHGSGKTTVSRRLRLEHPHDELMGPEIVRPDGTLKRWKKPIAFDLHGMHLCGRAKSGMDGILPQEIIEDLLRHYAPLGHVVWENVLVSANIGRWGRLAHELEPVNHAVWVFLTTPADLCIERVYQRREEAAAEGFKHRQSSGKIKEDVLRAHHRRTRRAAARAVAEGIDVRWLDHERAYELVHDMLIHHGWNCQEHGLLLPDEPELPRWQPSEEELEKVLKHAVLPWEDAPVTQPKRRTGSAAKGTRRSAEGTPQDGGAGAPVKVTAGTIVAERDVLSDPFVDIGDLFDA